MGRSVRIDKQSCLSSGRCVDAAPEGFGFDADHLGDVREPAAGLPLGELLAIALNCPSCSITVYDEDGNEIDP